MEIILNIYEDKMFSGSVFVTAQSDQNQMKYFNKTSNQVPNHILCPNIKL